MNTWIKDSYTGTVWPYVQDNRKNPFYCMTIKYYHIYIYIIYFLYREFLCWSIATFKNKYSKFELT